MLVYEYKIKANNTKLAAIDGAIRTAQYIRNKCLRFWMDAKPEQKINRFALNKYSTIVANDPEMPFAKSIHSNARQASAERAWTAIGRFYDNCKKKVAGKKGFPRFKRNSRSIEYKVGGWRLSNCRRHITFTDKTKIGTIKLVGSRDIQFVNPKDIKRVRLIKRVDGYYCQFCIKAERLEDCTPTGNSIGIDVGLESFYTDSNGKKVANPRYLRKTEKRLKRLQKLVSRKKKGSNNRRKAINRLGRKHLKISRQRKDFVVKAARVLCTSNDVIVIENLNVRGLVKNHNLAKSISDVSWSLFRQWLEYFGSVFNRQVIAVNPAYTSQDCSNCGKRVKKSLSTRTHSCSCGAKLCRDENAAINILNKGTVGHTVTAPMYGVNASGQMTLWLDSETSRTKVAG
ncbi:transposase [Waterburya agarophytonicola K14]|uniref:Transposase n=1 Tax=Waterburya agarophytonicola KI4 TaxID=2874699 RepID=A0A964BUP2_9CYAN|nr:transposase [Waterburya agarophytonicola KI4]